MTTKFFRKNNQRRTTLSRVAHLSCLLVLLTATFCVAAQNGVTVSGLAIETGSPTVVTFNVSWDKNNPTMPAVWSDSVWVFVDYNDGVEMKRLPLLPGATLTESSSDAGKVIEVPGNSLGVWIAGNAKTASSGSFSATVQLLTATTTASGACVYASNYPPVGEYTSTTDVSFTGTPNYTVWLTHTLSGATLTDRSDGNYTLFPGYVITAFTDATGAPGTFHCIPPAAPGVTKGEFCYEQSGTLVAMASNDGVTVEWYDAITGGTLLHTGEVLSLPPLYNNAAQYYAQAMYVDNCRSMRMRAEYTVTNCSISGECPGFTAGNVGAVTTPAACSSFYPGRIGAVDYPAACVAFDAGRIGKRINN